VPLTEEDFLEQMNKPGSGNSQTDSRFRSGNSMMRFGYPLSAKRDWNLILKHAE
jgi:hypothetical protein